MVHGKQIKDGSIKLIKVDPASGQLLTLVGTSKIQVNAIPTVGIDLVNKDYVDGLVTGLDFKNSVRVASNGANVAIATAPAVIDGITLALTERVLLKDQTAPTENGIYVFNGTGNALTRSTDADTNAEVTAGMFTFVEEGTWADTGWVLSTNNPISLGVTALTFTQFSAAGVITANSGLTKTANNITLGGALLSNTSIDGAANTYNLALENLNLLKLDSATATQTTTGNSTATIGATYALNTNNTIATSATNTDIVAGTDINLTAAASIIGTANTIQNNLSVSYDTAVTDTLTTATISAVPAVISNKVLDITNLNYGEFNVNIALQKTKMDYVTATGDDAFVQATDTSVLLGSNVGNVIEILHAPVAILGDASINNTMIITDANQNKGLVYQSDYSANFSNRSLVDKGYVDALVVSGSTADNGLTKTLANTQLGGVLLHNTTIDGAANAYSLDFTNLISNTITTSQYSLSTPFGAINMNGMNGGVAIDTTGGAITNSTLGGAYNISTAGGNYSATLLNTGNYSIVNPAAFSVSLADTITMTAANNVGITSNVGNVNIAATSGTATLTSAGTTTVASTVGNVTLSSANAINNNAIAINDTAQNYTGLYSNTYSLTSDNLNMQTTGLAQSLTINSADGLSMSSTNLSALSGGQVNVTGGALGGVQLNTIAGGNIGLTSNTSVDITATTAVNINAATNVIIAAGTNALSIDLYSAAGQTVSDTSTNNTMVVSDAVSSKGLVYVSDYSANFTDNSLVTKFWVNAQLTAGTITASNGLTKVANDITLGGALSANTVVDGALNAYDMTFGAINTFAVTANDFSATVANNYTLTGGGLSGYSLNVGAGGITETTSATYAESAQDITSTAVATIGNAAGTQIANTVTSGGIIAAVDINTGYVNSVFIDGAGTSTITTMSNGIFDTVSNGANSTTNTVLTTGSSLATTNGTNTSIISTTPTAAVMSNGTYNVTVNTTGVSLGAGAEEIKVFGAAQTIANNGANNFMRIADANGLKGMVYAADYSANFTPESLITKRYVDSALTAGTITASNGLTKTVNDITLGGPLTANTTINGAFDLNLGAVATELTNLNVLSAAVLIKATSGANIATVTQNATSINSNITDGVTTSHINTLATSQDLSVIGATSTGTILNNSTGNTLSVSNGVDSTSYTATIADMTLEVTNVTDAFNIQLFNAAQTVSDASTNNYMVVSDSTLKGLVYNADYTANFTANSLVTKQYVDNATGGISTVNDKSLVASVTTASGQQIAAGITSTPKNDSYVQVFVNGIKCQLGNGVNTVDVYFADPAFPLVPKAIAAITAGDILVRGTNLGYDTDATDIIEYDYSA